MGCGTRLDRLDADAASARTSGLSDSLHSPSEPRPPGPRSADQRPTPRPREDTTSRDGSRDLRSTRDSGEFRVGRDALRDVREARGNPWATQMIPALGRGPEPRSDSALAGSVNSRQIAMLCKECQKVTRKRSPYCEHCGRPLPNLEGSVLLTCRWSGGRNVAGEPAIYALCTVKPSIRFLSGTPARNLGFLIDGSVLRDGRGDSGRAKMVRKFLEHVVDEMSASDHLTVAFYGARPYLLVAGERIEDKKSAKKLIQKKLEALDLGEGRFLYEGIEQVCREVRRNLSQEKVNRVIILSDGPIQDPEESLRACEYEAEAGIGFSTLTLDEADSKNMQDLAHAGNGKCYPNVELRHIPEILSQELMTVRATFTTKVELFVHVDSGWALSRVFETSPVIHDLGRFSERARPIVLPLSDLQLYDDQTLLFELLPVSADPQRTTIAQFDLVCDFPHDDVTNMTFSLPLKIGALQEAWTKQDEEMLGFVSMLFKVFRG